MPKTMTKLTVSVPISLLKQIDKLAEHDLVSRSVKVRQALAHYARQPQYASIINPDSGVTKQMYETLKDGNPGLNPNDTELIQFLYSMKLNKQEQ